jgi:hypothetical protein
MKIVEVSEIEIRTFSIEDISRENGSVTDTREFDQLDLNEKIHLLDRTKVRSSYSDNDIGLGDAFERAMNEMYNGNGDVALIIEKRVLTLDRNIHRKAIQGSF